MPKAASLPGGPSEQFALYPAGLVPALALCPVPLCEMNGVLTPPTQGIICQVTGPHFLLLLVLNPIFLVPSPLGTWFWHP